MKFFCEYCGNRINDNVDDVCPNCGASYQRNEEYIKKSKEKEQQELKQQEFKKSIQEHVTRGMKMSKVITVFAITIFIVLFVLFLFNFIRISSMMKFF